MQAGARETRRAHERGLRSIELPREEPSGHPLQHRGLPIVEAPSIDEGTHIVHNSMLGKERSPGVRRILAHNVGGARPTTPWVARPSSWSAAEPGRAGRMRLRECRTDPAGSRRRGGARLDALLNELFLRHAQHAYDAEATEWLRLCEPA